MNVSTGKPRNRTVGYGRKLSIHPARMNARPVRVLTVLEANTLTGPAKAFIEFCRAAPDLRACAAVFRRPGDAIRHKAAHAALERALDEAGIHFRTIPERFRFDARVISQIRE